MKARVNADPSHHAVRWSMVISVISIGCAWGVALAVGTPLTVATSTGIPSVSRGSPSPSKSAGRALFVQSCAHCHGEDAEGTGEDGDGPNLHSLRISDARIATVIRHGIHGEMPSFARKFSEPDIEALIAYLRTLR